MFFSWPKVLGLAGAAPFDSFSKAGTTLSLRSEGAVISTTATGESRGSNRSLATVSACRGHAASYVITE
jgi:hypothetical protein